VISEGHVAHQPWLVTTKWRWSMPDHQPARRKCGNFLPASAWSRRAAWQANGDVVQPRSISARGETSRGWASWGKYYLVLVGLGVALLALGCSGSSVGGGGNDAAVGSDAPVDPDTICLRTVDGGGGCPSCEAYGCARVASHDSVCGSGRAAVVCGVGEHAGIESCSQMKPEGWFCGVSGFLDCCPVP
jgi:hypothetical protein